MNQKDKILDAICQSKPLFVKNTGILVSVEYYGTDADRFSTRNRNMTPVTCKVTIEGSLSSKSLKLFKEFHILKNSSNQLMELTGVIGLENLSLTPFESKAGKVLYEKTK